MSVPNDGAQVARLVTFLGLGRFDKEQDQYVYEPTEFEYLERRAAKTPYVCHALAELVRPSEITILATEEAQRAHGDALKEKLRGGNFPAPCFVRIPFGRQPSELRQQFQAIKTELRRGTGPVMLDITHGFRSQPFFAAAVANFVLAVDEEPPRLRVCYAAFEAKDTQTGVAPIWELTEFVTLLDWSRALAMFLRTGRAEAAGSETERLGRDLKKDWFQSGKEGDEPKLKDLGEALKQFGSDLETLRTGDLLFGGEKSSAARLLEAARRAKEDAELHAQPLADVLNRVVAMVEPLVGAGADLSGENGRKVVPALADLYLRLGRYLEAAATVREGWVNLYAAKAALVPGAASFDKSERERAENRARLLRPLAKENPTRKILEPKDLDPQFSKISKIRNDLLHAQYNDSASAGGRIVQTVKQLVEEFKRASHDSAGACFVNLTNHPSAKWDALQTKAALALAEPIIDVAFPTVPPDADEGAVAALAEQCVAKVPREASHALVQGEFTLAAELVRRLQNRGIVCVAATSERMVQEAADGSRASMFRFVRFRKYPDPSQASA